MEPAVATYADRPDLVARLGEVSNPWPEFIHHANCNRLWHVMGERFPEFQLVLYEADGGRVLGRGQTIPVRWDGTVAGLPGGVDDALEQGAALADGEGCARSSRSSTRRRRAVASARESSMECARQPRPRGSGR